MKNYGNYWNAYPGMTQDQYNVYLQSYMQQHNQGYLIPPTVSPYAEYEHLVRQGIIPREQPPPPENPKDNIGIQTLNIERNPELDTPDEIEKWLEQRRKNFPTKTRIEAKKNLEIMKEEKGALRKSELSKLEIKLRQKIKYIESETKTKKKKKKNKAKKQMQKGGIVENVKDNPQKINEPTITSSQKEEIMKEFKREILESIELEEGEIVESKKEQGEFNFNIEQHNIGCELPKDINEKKINLEESEKKGNIEHEKTQSAEKPKEIILDKKPIYKKEKKIPIRFKYRKNNLYNLLIQKEVNMEHSILLQIFRHFVKNKIV